jgi:heat shock protein HtpX
MWEQIRTNKRKSLVLVFFMALLLMALGFTIGEAVLGGGYGVQGGAPFVGGVLGLLVALFIWFVLAGTAYFQGGRILLHTSGARRIEKADHPQLFNVVEEMTIASGLPKMPEVYIIDDLSMNAFATGRDERHSAVAVTSGLLARLNRDQLQGVIAHEIGHITNRDVLFMQLLGVMAGAIVLISEGFLRALFYSGGARRSRRSSSRGGGGGQAQLVFFVIAIVLAILSPILARLIYLAASRKREYLADAQAAVYTRYPAGLASALEQIATDSNKLAAANRATAPMYIINPLQKMAASGWFSTHPPTEQRIQILRSMAGAASYAEYQRAAAQTGAASPIPASALQAGGEAPIRAASAETEPVGEARQRLREATDAVRSANNFLFLACACGMKLKLPPEFKKDHVECPRCHRDLVVPVAGLAAVGALGRLAGGQPDASADAAIPFAQAKNAAKPGRPAPVRRLKNDWQSFKCECGRAVNLSPAFQGSQVTCRKCGRTIEVESS